jgi:membrane protease subunit HflK
LYLDTMQELMSNTSKVLVTGDKGQNNLLYLPLDKMIDGRGSSASGSISAAGVSDASSRVKMDPRQVELRTRESR